MNASDWLGFSLLLGFLSVSKARANNFDLAVGYSPSLLIASNVGSGSASYPRFLGFSFNFGYVSPVGVIELDSYSGFELNPYLQDVSVLGLGLRRYFYRIQDFGPTEFWMQSSLRSFEPYWGAGLGRIDQQSPYLTQSETIGVVNLTSWGPYGVLGLDWSPRSADVKDSKGTVLFLPFSGFVEGRFKALIWPETVPVFVFYHFAAAAGLRFRF